MPGEVSSSPLITREAQRADHPAFVRFWGEFHLDHGAPDVDYWDVHLRPRTIFLQAPNGDLAAYALTFSFGTRGDVRQIAVDPAYRNQGVGRRLFDEIASRYRAAGVTEWRLEVRKDNAPAIALYRSVGMEVLRELETLRLSREGINKLARPGDVSVVDPSDDATLEDRFDLGRGQLGRWRDARGANALMLRIGTNALAHYTPDFAAGFGLVFPLRATTEEQVGQLFGAIREHGLRDVIEMLAGDAPVLAAVRRAGARHLETMFEMGGPLPPAP
jgi:ribosomal protein S18 acetylase RimI-like enzyme